MESTLEQFVELINLEKEQLAQSDELKDDGTNALISGLLSKHKETIWMLSSWLKSPALFSRKAKKRPSQATIHWVA